MIVHKTISLADQVFNRLEEEILSGVYKRGEILTEMRLCEALGVSRTPIREARKRLEHEHNIEDCGKGMRVLSITADDAACIYEMRRRIEGLAARACAENINDDDLAQMREVIDLQEFYATRGDSEHVKVMDSEFHLMVYRCSGTTVLFDTLAPLHRKIQKYRKANIESKSRAVESVAEHRAIYEAIASRDADAAERAMTNHVTSARDRLPRLKQTETKGE